jgi:serine/threonine-protein kinase
VTNEFERLTRALANRYAIERELGRGGMATVYLARDIKHERRVAIKVLRPELTFALGRERFLREIRLTAQLNHPHILPLLDSGQSDDFLYYVMPYVEGESLRDRLKREKQLGVEDAVQIAREVAEALDCAHRHGVVHRDVKPENVLLREHHAVVADFGIARAISVAGGDKLTETGLVVGTCEYMSPEQAGGEHELDGRSDIYALACVLYEMLAGQPPFTGATVQSVVLQHLTAEPARVTTKRPGVPMELAETIQRALAKVPADRIPSAAEFAVALTHSGEPAIGSARQGRTGQRVAVALVLALVLGGGWWAIHAWPAGSRAIDAIAVLPLTNNMGDPEQQYFVDAMHDALIGELAQLHALKTVISRTSTLRYRGTDKPAPQIARELGVEAVVEGSVFQAGDSVRIEVKLIGVVPTEHLLYAGTFDGALREVLSIQKKIARAIAEKIQVSLTPQEQVQLATARTVDPAAYDAWARGWFEFSRLTETSLRKCIEYADAALEIDSIYAPAYALTASCWNLLPHIAPVAPEHAFENALAASSRALELDERLADGHFARAWTLAAYYWDWAGAEKEYRRGLQLNSGAATGHSRFGWFLSWLGRDEEALAEVSRAVELNPAGPNEIQELAGVHYVGRRYDDAVTAARRAIDIDPGFVFGYTRLGMAYIEKGMHAEAVAAFETAVELSGGSVTFKGPLGRAYALAGRRTEARRILEELRNLSERRYGAPLQIAMIHTALGEKNEALRWLEVGYRVHDGNMVLLKVFPSWDPLRSDPRFRDLIRRMNFPEPR